MSSQELQLAILHNVTSRLGDVGKIQLQKLAYFLQEGFGVPTKFSFRMHHYGPYAEDLETATSRLRLAGYIQVEPDSEGYGFHITSSDQPLEEWSELVEPFSESIDDVVEAFGDKMTSELELAATIHYMTKLRPELPATELIESVRALKPKFDENYVSKAYNELEQLDLIFTGETDVGGV